jgi:aurora kinase
MTYCGTMDYVSPEIVEGKEYGEGVDMWCVGVLTFELLSGRPPFYHLSRQETFRKIEEADPSYPSYFSLQAKDFIGKLLKKVPEERMSSVDALLHPFLANAEK